MLLFNVIRTRRARVVLFNRKHQNSNTTTYNLKKKTKSTLDIKLASNDLKGKRGIYSKMKLTPKQASPPPPEPTCPIAKGR